MTAGEAVSTGGGQPTDTAALALRGVSRAYREGETQRDVLRGVDLEAAAGEFIAIGGPSGSGKSTLLHLAAGLDVPDAGTIVVGGSDIGSLTAARRTLFRRRQVGMVFQFFNLVPTLTVAENLRLPLALNGLPVDADRIDGLLDTFGLADHRRDYPATLSGGEQQRVAVLRAAIHEPALILADEPTGNLDRERGDGVIDLLRTLAGRGTCVLMVTHSRHAAGAADRRLRLDSGRLTPWDW